MYSPDTWNVFAALRDSEKLFACDNGEPVTSRVKQFTYKQSRIKQ